MTPLARKLQRRPDTALPRSLLPRDGCVPVALVGVARSSSGPAPWTSPFRGSRHALLPCPPARRVFRAPPATPHGAPWWMVHGYTVDRASLSILARRLAMNAYAALAIDVRGHGANRHPFSQDPEGSGLFEDLSAAADWLRGSAWVDGSRLAVLGHSMGAGAALRFAERDSALDAAVMISGGWALLGPHRPPNALFLYAERDPAGIRDSAPQLAARLAGVLEVKDGERYGAFATREAVRALELPDNDHSTILWSKAATRRSRCSSSFCVKREGERARRAACGAGGSRRPRLPWCSSLSPRRRGDAPPWPRGAAATAASPPSARPACSRCLWWPCPRVVLAMACRSLVPCSASRLAFASPRAARNSPFPARGRRAEASRAASAAAGGAR